MVYLGTDHRGFALKEELKEWLEHHESLLETGEDVVRDLGAKKYDEKDDYPIISARVGRHVATETVNRGVVLCGSGVGVSAAVNKINGIRGALGLTPKQVQAGRHDDDMNVLVVAADYTDFEEAKELVRVFLETTFDDETERYQRRIDQITELEQT